MRIQSKAENCEVYISSERFEKQLLSAQDKLDMQVLADSNFYIPVSSSALRNSGKIEKRGVIMWDVPYAHYQYNGELYIDADLNCGGIYNQKTGEWFSRRGVTKVPSGRKLNYNTSVNPNASSEWFEVAKKEHLKDWVEIVRKIGGGGKYA